MESIPPAGAEFDPLIVTSPTIRCGTTLLQRLLCSSENALIYGETCAHDLEFFLHTYAAKALLYRANRRDFEEDLDAVVAGRVNDWIPNLMPDIDGYVEALGRACFAGIASCRDHARRMGRVIWGFKCPGLPAATLRLMCATMPRCRVLYLHRDVVDALKSAKAVGSMSRSQTEQFCRDWAASLDYALNLAGPGVLVLGYAELLADPERCLERVAAFSGSRGIKRAALEHRINSDRERQDGRGREPRYVPPQELTQEEMAIVAALTGRLRRQLYGS